MTALPAPIRPRLAKLVPMLGSDHDGEVVGAARAITRTLRNPGRTLHDLAEEVSRVQARDARARAPMDDWHPITWADLARWCVEHDRGRLGPRDRAFIHDVALQFARGRDPSFKQRDWVRAICIRLGGECHAG